MPPSGSTTGPVDSPQPHPLHGQRHPHQPGRPQGRRRRTSLATRIALLSVGIAVVTALIAGALATGLIRNAGNTAARNSLKRYADVVATAASGTGPTAQKKIRTALAGFGVRTGLILRNGTVLPDTAIVQQALTGGEIQAVLNGQDVHASANINGTTLLVEARPTTPDVSTPDRKRPVAGIVAVQRRVDAVAQDERAIQRLFWALLIAGGLAAIIGLLVAWRMARPLRRTAAAAHSLAAGNRDVTLPAQGPAEAVEVSEAINTLAGALRYSEARQRHFLLSVSHDLRTPLTAISGYAESMAEDVIPPEETAHVGSVLLGEAKRLERLVGDLLDLARLDAQDFRIELAAVDLVGVVRDAAQVWAARCAGAGIPFHLDAPGLPIWTHTDANRVRQLLDGLFDNALRVTPGGAPIVLATWAEPGQALVEVRDGGPGLTDADLGVAFEQGALYERYRGVRQVGTGLGLAIVQGLVARLGGQIEAGHATEGGARFTVRLPLERPPGFGSR